MSTRPPYVCERFQLSAPVPADRIDREKGIVRGVRAVNSVSKNNRFYPEAVRQAAIGMYASPVNLGHHYDAETGLPVEVPPQDRFGRLINPRIEDGATVADLHFNPKHQFAESFLWAVEHCPSLYCFSHLARVRWAEQPDAEGRRVAEAIEEVASVDIVTEGGTTVGIFESFSPGVNAMNPADIAKTLTDATALQTFLTGLFGALTLDDSAKQSALEAVMSTMGGEVPSTETPAAAMEHLNRLGKFGKWAAKRLDTFFAAEALSARKKWATDLVTAEGLDPALRSDLFLELVAEQHTNPERAKALIAERKALAVPQSGGARTTTPGNPVKSVKELVAEYSAG